MVVMMVLVVIDDSTFVGDDITSRFIFTNLATRAQHIQRIPICDLFLDTVLYNAHSTATEVLWSGVPIITYPQHKMVARVAASLSMHHHHHHHHHPIITVTATTTITIIICDITPSCLLPSLTITTITIETINYLLTPEPHHQHHHNNRHQYTITIHHPSLLMVIICFCSQCDWVWW